MKGEKEQMMRKANTNGSGRLHLRVRLAHVVMPKTLLPSLSDKQYEIAEDDDCSNSDE
jgi:hypothetical protein